MKVTDKSALLLLVAASALAGCGGGGSGGSNGGGGFVGLAESSSASTTTAPETAATKEAAPVSKLDASWIKVADENQSFTLGSATVVQYGANDTYANKSLSGTVACSNATFGDPTPYVAKACYTQTATAPAPA